MHFYISLHQKYNYLKKVKISLSPNPKLAEMVSIPSAIQVRLERFHKVCFEQSLILKDGGNTY